MGVQIPPSAPMKKKGLADIGLTSFCFPEGVLSTFLLTLFEMEPSFSKIALNTGDPSTSDLRLSTLDKLVDLFHGR